MEGSIDPHLTNVLGALTLALADQMREATEAAARHAAAGPSALVALHEFLDRGSMDALRRAVGLTPSGAVRLVDRLVEQGLVERRPGTDARSVALVLTPSGRAAAEAVLAARAAPLESALSSLSAEERGQLTNIVDKLVRAVTTERLDARHRGAPPAGGWLCRLCDFDACGRGAGACPAASTAAAWSPRGTDESGPASATKEQHGVDSQAD